MVIRELSKEECLRLLASARLVRLACANENQPYVVPVYLTYSAETECLYGFTTLGQKVEWMRSNPRVCVEVDEMTASDQWVSVITTGRYEELPATSHGNFAPPRNLEHSQQDFEAFAARPDTSDCHSWDDDREQAWMVLKNHPEWWEPGAAVWAARVHRDAAEPYTPIYYRIRIENITGHEATPGPGGKIEKGLSTESPSWLRRVVSRIFCGQR